MALDSTGMHSVRGYILGYHRLLNDEKRTIKIIFSILLMNVPGHLEGTAYQLVTYAQSKIREELTIEQLIQNG